ncbi:hypothetical protein RMSM_04821 [Rhodopirellula maiorica SM1]|uniref:Uncharacterized protein n=1 Tax=Rhodopirellula maiorica SM1 TaxID=1265738 RepID=M5RFU9_9BACT|nr:hypothetical protein RMSM_04821 [Rhodopirellula maiorica SM1]
MVSEGPKGTSKYEFRSARMFVSSEASRRMAVTQLLRWLLFNGLRRRGNMTI